MKYGINHRPVVNKEIAEDFYSVLIVSKKFST